MLEIPFLISAFVTLFVVIDPIGTAPLFLALTQGMSARQRRAVGLRACFIAALLLMAFAVAGEDFLRFIGISMPAFQIAGGLLLFLTALDMLFDRRTERRQNHADEGTGALANDPSVFPLAMPLIAGPGAMATMVLLINDTGGTWEGTALISGVMLAVIALVLLAFLAAAPIERILRRTGTMVLTRLFGLLLSALSVQFVLNGATALGILPNAAPL
ncbi:MarC family protein [Roseibaca sp. Y0-43]|uniref:MarC family protein n=1 Tax=Roseibaca sp. Y0-43 TaxID=2816854 RepID=UPI001D0BF89F|nr:MarC family protein [Roseibaca sp. Y0-43]MCC1481517.1 NAAT family transporter [Roseibaca sp. Y0-43]